MSRREFINVLDRGTARLPVLHWAHGLGNMARLKQGLGLLGFRAFVDCARYAIAVTAMVGMGFGAGPAAAQKHGGTLRAYISANPSSLSILEEVSFTTVMAAGPMFNGLVVFDPMRPVGSIDTVIPELAQSWSWDASGTTLTFKLRGDVKWHDGKPFTAKDVQCTWHWL